MSSDQNSMIGAVSGVNGITAGTMAATSHTFQLGTQLDFDFNYSSTIPALTSTPTFTIPAQYGNIVFQDSTYSNSLFGSNADLSGTGKLSLKGNQADIDINGVSLMKTLVEIQERLNILTPNIELEAEWEELKRLGQRYRKLEAKILAKKQTFDILSKK